MASITGAKGSSMKGKEWTQDDISVLCSNIEELLVAPDKSTDCSTQLRQLHNLMQTYVSGLSFTPKIPQSLVRSMVQVLIDSPQPKLSGGSSKYLLCQMLVGEESVEVSASDLLNLVSSKSGGNANMSNLYLRKGQQAHCLEKIVTHAKVWLLSQDFENQKTGLFFLTADLIATDEKLMDDDISTIVSERIAHWLSTASLHQAPNPRALNPFRKDEESLVTEVDGTPSTNLFTTLNIGQYYTEDQLMNIHSFSCLYEWLHNMASRCSTHVDSSAEGDEATAATAAQRDAQGSEDVLQRENSKPEVDKVRVKKLLGSLINKSVEYCFRLIDQCERKPKVASDGELQLSCLIEAVRILDIICSLEKDQTARVFQEMKRLNARISQESRYSTALIHIIAFFFNHSATVVHDPRDTYHNFFTRVLADNLNNQGFTTSVIDFLIKNHVEIADKTDIFSDYFPSIFKILAWHPRLYMKPFTTILRMSMNLDTSVELFHLLLDLPCMTAALEVMEKTKKSEPLFASNVPVDSEPSTATEAFYHPRYRPFFLYITRAKGGQGDTIDRLSRLHFVLRENMTNTRVMVCCQLVPVLLRIWFLTVLDSEDATYLAQLIPVVIERSSILSAVPALIKDVHKIFADQLVALIKAFPSIVTIQQGDIREFIQTTANMAGREEIYSNMIYVVGEFASAAHCSDCTSETIGHFYEGLEVVAYELLGQLSDQEQDTGIPKVLSCIISALAKLASRCQDLIPRAILCLTKVVKQQNLILLSPTTKDFIVHRASSLIALLKNPDTATMVLNPDPEIYTARWHQDNTSIPTILRSMERILRLND